MNIYSVRLRQLLLGISLDEALAERRGFDISDPAMRARLERVGVTFILGYSQALEARSIDDLGSTLDSVELEWRGFAYEGAAMALALLDCLALGQGDMLVRFLRGPGDPHRYMVHVGAGWAMARLPFGSRRVFRQLDPMLKWLAIDGLGFHEGYFHWRGYCNGAEGKKRPSGYGAHAFDQGLGRSLWFVKGGCVREISGSISQFSQSRRADLWSGIGLACAYAGVLSNNQLNELKAAAAFYSSSLAQGAAFAAKARQRAGNEAAHTDNTCQVLCGTSASHAAAITDAALNELEAPVGKLNTPVSELNGPASKLSAAVSKFHAAVSNFDDDDAGTPRYEVWRKRTAAAFVEQGLISHEVNCTEQEFIGL
jgi:hypothetical protein